MYLAFEIFSFDFSLFSKYTNILIHLSKYIRKYRQLDCKIIEITLIILK